MSQLDTRSAPPPSRLVFVCTGNICRSPMAEVITRSFADATTLADGSTLGTRLVVTSAGTGPWHEGGPMDPRTTAALVRRGYPDHPHVAHQISAAQLGHYDLIVALDRRHHQTLRSLGADPHRLVLLRAFDPAGGAAADVPDPYYGDAAAFDDCLAMIAAGCAGLVSGAGRPVGGQRPARVGRLAPPGPDVGRTSGGHFWPRLMMAKVVCHSADVVSRRVRRRRRQFTVAGVLVFLLLIYVVFFSGGGKKATPPAPSKRARPQAFPAHSPLNPDWTGSGNAVTLAFGGDVHFAGAVGNSLQEDPSTALGTTFPTLFAGAQLSMVNFESALTAGTCPEPQNKPFIFFAPPTALTALQQAGVTVASDANDHSVDCGQEGLSQGLTAIAQAKYPMLGIGSNAAQAFTPYRATIKGQRVAIITATQVIAPNLVTTWTATSSQAGVASAIDPTQLVQTVQAARRTSDTVVVYLHWGTETVTCPNPQQEPLAQQLVKAGADIVVGSGTHVLSGGGYLGGAYVDYGLGNFAFYDSAAAGIRQRIVVGHRHRAKDCDRRLPSGHRRQRVAPTPHRYGRANGGGQLGCGARLHRPLGRPGRQPSHRGGRDGALRRPPHHTRRPRPRPRPPTTATTSTHVDSSSTTTTTTTTTPATTTAPTDNAG